jgi:hypothetical protein
MKSIDGNYIYVRRLVSGVCVPIYIGQGRLSDRCDINSHHQGRCIKSKSVNELHVHANLGVQARLAEEKDLLANHPEAYKPNGCNERPGG